MSNRRLIAKYKAVRADLAKHLPRLTVEDLLYLNRASVTIRRAERETEAEAAQIGGNHVD